MTDKPIEDMFKGMFKPGINDLPTEEVVVGPLLAASLDKALRLILQATKHASIAQSLENPGGNVKDTAFALHTYMTARITSGMAFKVVQDSPSLDLTEEHYMEVVENQIEHLRHYAKVIFKALKEKHHD